jgi:cytochrome c biogenesis protein CcmG, thiol:disulfide interchange protein DsbE
MTRRQALMLAPLGVAGVAGVGFWAILQRMAAGTYDPHTLPSQLIGRKLPNFDLVAQAPSLVGFSSAELAAPPQPILVNFFASWCVPCVEETDELMTLKQSGIPIWGIAYKDKPDAAAAFLKQHGNPYQRLGADPNGLVAINFGVYGVPETYLVDRTGTVRWRYAGALDNQVVGDTLHPLLQRYA